MEKIEKLTVIFEESMDREPTWADIKHIEFQDTDLIRCELVEGYYSENNSWDAHFSITVTRVALETDEEYEDRKSDIIKQKDEMNARRYKTYLALKDEFELPVTAL